MRASGKTNAERLHPSATHWAMIPLVTGILIGMAISTVFLIRPHTAITNVYLELPSEREDVSARLNDLRRMLNHLDASRRPSEVEKLAEEVDVKDPVYYAVVMSRRHSSEQLKVLRDTWTGDTARQRVGYFIPVEDQPQVADGAATEDWEDAHYGEIRDDSSAVVELPSLHSDFHMDVISYLCRTKLNDTKWVILAGDNVYIKSQELEEYLLHYDTGPMGYLGRSSTSDSTTPCVRGPGTILSHSVLVDLCNKVDTCSEDEESVEAGAVETCIAKQLEHNCNSHKAKVMF